jgi:hypothetical protein
MKCGDFDPRDIALGDWPGRSAKPRRSILPRAKHCACRERNQADGFRMRLSADREIPRRIAFVSDPVFQLSWWQRFWRSGPKWVRLRAVLSCAILAHTFVPRSADHGSRIEQLAGKWLSPSAAVDAASMAPLKPGGSHRQPRAARGQHGQDPAYHGAIERYRPPGRCEY